MGLGSLSVFSFETLEALLPKPPTPKSRNPAVLHTAWAGHTGHSISKTARYIVEGCHPQNSQMIWVHGCLKVDRLIVELELPPMEIYQRLARKLRRTCSHILALELAIVARAAKPSL